MTHFHDIEMTSITGETQAFKAYKGQICLVVNVASQWGLTPQYAGLRTLHNDNDDLVVLGFPCNQFGAQEPGTDAEILEFVTSKFDVNFPMFSKIEVNGDGADPLYAFLREQQPGEGESSDIAWNFTKFLVNRNGEVLKRFAPTTKPEEMRGEIKEVLQDLSRPTVIVTHDQEEAMLMSDRIFLMNQGEIVQQGNPEDIYTKPVNEFVASFMGNYNLISAETAKHWFNINSNNKVAIRPESIYIKDAGRQYADHISSPKLAKIISHQLLGNVIRYNLKVENEELTVDLLNRSSERLMPKGSSIELLFNLNEIQPVGV